MIINSPVQFQMMPESDVKVQDTSSAHSKLVIRDHQQLPPGSNITQLNQIISPTEVMANPPQNSDFYELNKREIKSNQVNKKMDMALKAIPSDDVSDNHTEVAEASKPLDISMSPSPSPVKGQQKTPAAVEDDSLLPLSLDKEGFSQEKAGIATAQLQEWQNDSKPANGESQFFRSQKMAGLGELTQKAEKNDGEDLGAADLELEKKMDSESVIDSANPGAESQRSYGNFIKKFEAKASMQKRTGGLMGLGLGNASDLGSNLEAGLEDILDSGNFHNDDPMFHEFNQASAQKDDKIDSQMLNLNQDDIGLDHVNKRLILPETRDGQSSDQTSEKLPAFLDNPKMKLGDDKMKEGASDKNSLLQSLEIEGLDGFDSRRSQSLSEDQETMVTSLIKQLVGDEIDGAL